MILESFVKTGWTFGGWILSPWIPLAAFAAASGIDRRVWRNTGWVCGIAIAAIVLAGYYAVYLTTPMDLRWHLDSSLERLLMHLWPSFLLLLGVALAGEPAAEPDPASG